MNSIVLKKCKVDAAVPLSNDPRALHNMGLQWKWKDIDSEKGREVYRM
jgi:hypothetical protein